MSLGAHHQSPCALLIPRTRAEGDAEQAVHVCCIISTSNKSQALAVVRLRHGTEASEEGVQVQAPAKSKRKACRGRHRVSYC